MPRKRGGSGVGFGETQGGGPKRHKPRIFAPREKVLLTRGRKNGGTHKYGQARARCENLLLKFT